MDFEDENKPDYCYTISELAQITNYNDLKYGKPKDNDGLVIHTNQE